ESDGGHGADPGAALSRTDHLLSRDIKLLKRGVASSTQSPTKPRSWNSLLNSGKLCVRRATHRLAFSNRSRSLGRLLVREGRTGNPDDRAANVLTTQVSALGREVSLPILSPPNYS